MQDKDKNILFDYEKLVKFLQDKLRIKEAVCFDKRVRYFRNDDLLSIIQENHDHIQKILSHHWTFEHSIQDEKEAKKFISDMLENKIIWKLERGPDEPKFKWPKKLYISRDQANQADSAFYGFVIVPRSKSTKVYTFLIIAAVVALCLFQLWPLSVKLGVFYTSVVLLYIMIGIILIRLAIYVTFRILGFDVYIFPNLFEEVSFLDSFKPFISFDKCEDGAIGYAARAFGLVFLAYFMYVLSQEPEIVHEYKDMGVQSFDDIVAWGRLKLEGKVEDLAAKDDFKQRIKDLLDAADEDEAIAKGKKPEEEGKEEGAGTTVESEGKEDQSDDGKKEVDDDYIRNLVDKETAESQKSKDESDLKEEKGRGDL
jgi:translocation protein SEC62